MSTPESVTARHERYRRVSPADAPEPVPGMRIYARSPSGRFGVVVVHRVGNGQVYYAQRHRWGGSHPFAGWGLFRTPIELWQDLIGRTFAIKVPVQEPPHADA